MINFPDDDDGDVLRSLQRQGVDLSKPRSIDFYCYARDRATADQIAAFLDEYGFKSDVSDCDEPEPAPLRYSVYAATWMVPDYDALLRTQAEINDLLRQFGTHCDGWGTLVDPHEVASGPDSPAQPRGSGR